METIQFLLILFVLMILFFNVYDFDQKEKNTQYNGLFYVDNLASSSQSNWGSLWPHDDDYDAFSVNTRPYYYDLYLPDYFY